MAIPPLPPCHDLVRLVRPTLPDTTAVLLEHLRRKPNPWSYHTARSLAPYAFSTGVPIGALQSACASARMVQAGKTATWEVVQMIRKAGEGRDVQCHAMQDARLQVRQDLALRVAADFYFVEAGRVSVFWLQPRRAFGLDIGQLGMFAALLRMALLQGDFADAGVEILDLSAPDRRGRVARTLTLDSLPQVGEGEVAEAIQRIAEAYDAIRAMGIDWDEVRGRSPRPRRSPDDQQPLPGLDE